MVPEKPSLCKWGLEERGERRGGKVNFLRALAPSLASWLARSLVLHCSPRIHEHARCFEADSRVVAGVCCLQDARKITNV